MKVIVKAFLVLSVVAGVISGCATKSDFNELKDRVDKLEADQIQDVAGQITSINNSLTSLQNADTELKTYIETLKGQAESLETASGNLEKAIETLQKKDEDLQKQIDELKAYAENGLKDTRDWAAATFATLEEYNKTAEIVAGIQTRVEALKSEIAEASNKALTDALAKSEESMRNWINEQLTGYYTIAEMDTKLELLEDELNEQKKDLTDLIGQNTEELDELAGVVDENANAISDLSDSLTAQKAAITKAYTKAIATAVENQGKINKTVQDTLDKHNSRLIALDSRVTKCEKDITSIKADISAIKKDIESLQNTLRNLASISYIPAYSDHIERVEYTGIGSLSIQNAKAKDLKLRFDVYPKSSADSIANAWIKFVSKVITESPLSARAVYTRTRADAGDFVDLNIKDVLAKEGVLTVVISATELGNEFVLGKLSSSLVLRVDTGANLIQSEYIPLVPEAGEISFTQYMVGNFDTNGDGNLDDDEKGAIKSLDFSNMTDLSSLDLTIFPDLAEVICPSLDWLLSMGENLQYNNTVTFYSPARKKLISDNDVLIDGLIWQKYNVGATVSNIAGDKFTFADAQIACPSGYRLPTIDEYSSLVYMYHYMGRYEVEYYYLGAKYEGHMFSGTKRCYNPVNAPDVPAVFFPLTVENPATAHYWTSTKNTETSSRYLYFEPLGVPNTNLAINNDGSCCVRCVKE